MSPTEERLIRVSEVRHMVGFSTSKIYDLMTKNQFPKQIKVGGSSVWRLSDIQNYVAQIAQKAGWG